MCPNRTSAPWASPSCVSGSPRTKHGTQVWWHFPAHDPASVVGHGDRNGREERMKTGTGAGSQAGKQKRQGPTRTDLRYVLTLAFLAFGLCHVIYFSLRFRNVLCFRAAFPQRPGPRLDCRQTARGEKIPHGGWPAVFPAAVKTSTGRGGGCKEPRRRGPGLPCAQAFADFRRDQRRRSDLFLLISAAVLRLWQRWQRLWRLPGSVNTAQLPLWSRMWSTSVALVRMPC